MIIVTSSISDSFVLKMFPVHTKTPSRRFQIPSVWRAFLLFEKLRFRYGLVWTKALTGEIKLRFQIPLAQCGLGLNERFFIGLIHSVFRLIDS